MTPSLKLIVSEPAIDTPEQYARRVTALAWLFSLIFVFSLAGIGVLCWWGKYLVTLSQRANVETLTLAFFFVFFLYVGLLTRSGVWGALQIAWFRLRRGDFETRERRKMRRLPPRRAVPTVALNVVVVMNGQETTPLAVEVADSAGRVGTLEIDGASMRFRPERDHGSNNILAYAVRQLEKSIKERGRDVDLDIVAWKTIDDESTERYLATVGFARNLQRALKSEPLWPSVVVTKENLDDLSRSLGAICPALRNESFLPDWEYAAEHKLPVVPEPLGLASLGRSEQRADPVVSLGLMLGMVTVALAGLLFVIFFPPWVPSA